MIDRPQRIVDAHVHFWDPANTAWYPYLSGHMEIGMGNVTGMSRLFDPETYRAESPGWNVVAFVNVTAATGINSVAETLEMDKRADSTGHPSAIIGGLPPADTITETIELIETQMNATRFRGVRPMGQKAPTVPADEILTALAERSLIFELMAHPPDLAGAARQLANHPNLRIVVEHTGWPRSADPEEHRLWTEGINALAAVGPNVFCKISGLAMPLGAITVPAMSQWVMTAIETFGVERCMFASNFPVDGMHGSLTELWSVFSDLTGAFRTEERDLLFAGVAESVYGIPAPN